MKRKKHLLYIGLLLLSVPLAAQESVNGSGGEATGSGGSVSYSVGQVVYQTHTGASNSEAQGVQQPYEISVVTGISELPNVQLSCKVYPNPSTNHLHLEVEKLDSDLSYTLYSVDGKLLANKKVTEHISQLSMADYVPSTYLLEVKKGANLIQTFKIIKN